jgi:mono/diheme cytochrome c family protein
MKKVLALAVMGMMPAVALAQPEGKDTFAQNCAACHQATGAGIPGAFPALKANKFVQGEADAVITTVLKGRGGMPTFAESLDDAQLAAAISYIRTSWGNTAGAVSQEQVKTVRAKSNAGDTVVKEQPTNVH